MKQAQLLSLRSLFIFCFLTLFSVLTYAQDNTGSGNSGGETTTTTTTTTKTTDINITTESGDWYTQPWVWIVGAAVFILLLVALLSGGKRDRVTTDRVIVKKTVERDGDTKA